MVAEAELCYLDGNSLGRPPRATANRLAQFFEREWAGDLVEGWDRWIDLPTAVGDELGRVLLGASPGQVVVCDSVTVNLYKLAGAALAALPDRSVLVVPDGEFPTDRYVLEGLASRLGHEVRMMRSDPIHGVGPDDVAAVVDERVALVCLSMVDYRTSAVADLVEITRLIHDAGAVGLWDLSHAVGSVPIQLDRAGVDLAVGCTYKYLNAGPGAPAFLYVRDDLQPRLRQPIWGWFGHRDQFAMADGYEPSAGIGRFLIGTPNLAGTIAVEEGVRLFAEAGIGAVRDKGQRLTSLLIELVDGWLDDLGFELASPRAADRRGAHVGLAHPDAGAISQALRRRARVVADYRPPDLLRLGPAPLSSRFVALRDEAWGVVLRVAAR